VKDWLEQLAFISIMSDGELPWPLFAILPDAGRFRHGVALVAF
jgi:hypothetical protein